MHSKQASQCRTHPCVKKSLSDEALRKGCFYNRSLGQPNTGYYCCSRLQGSFCLRHVFSFIFDKGRCRTFLGWEVGSQWRSFCQAEDETIMLTDPLVQWSVSLLEQHSSWCLFANGYADLLVKCQLSRDGAYPFSPLVYLHSTQQCLSIIWDHSGVELTNIYSWADFCCGFFFLLVSKKIKKRENTCNFSLPLYHHCQTHRTLEISGITKESSCAGRSYEMSYPLLRFFIIYALFKRITGWLHRRCLLQCIESVNHY